MTPPERLIVEIPTSQLQDEYKRWRGLEPTGVEEVDRAREYYIGLLRKELQKRGALYYIPPSDNPGHRSLKMPEDDRISPAVIIPLGLALGLAATLWFFALAQAAPAGYPCPYCPEAFDTYEELVAHVQAAHPGERIPIHIVWM